MVFFLWKAALNISPVTTPRSSWFYVFGRTDWWTVSVVDRTLAGNNRLESILDSFLVAFLKNRPPCSLYQPHPKTGFLIEGADVYSQGVHSESRGVNAFLHSGRCRRA